MKTYSFQHCPHSELLARVDAGHRRLPPSSYYLEILCARYAKNRSGILAYIYVKVLSTADHYAIGISGREDDSIAFRTINSLPEGAIVWADITATKQGYSRISRLEVVAADGLKGPSSMSKICWDFASRGRVEMPLRVPWIFQPGVLSTPRIAVVWQSPGIEFYPGDFADPAMQWPELLCSSQNLAAAMLETPRRRFQMADFIEFLQGQEPSFDLQDAGDSNQPSIGDRIGAKAPFSVMHTFLSPVVCEGGVKHCRSQNQPVVSDTHILRTIMRLWRPQLVILGGAEVARALPKVLRPLAHNGFYQLPKLAKISRESLTPLEIVRQEFESRWSADFVVTHDLRFFGKRRIGSRVLATDYWQRVAAHLKSAIGNLGTSKYPDSDGYSKSTEQAGDSVEPAVDVNLSVL